MKAVIALFTLFNLVAGLRLGQGSEDLRGPAFEKEVEDDLEDDATPVKVTWNDGSLSFGQGCPNPEKPKLAICVAGLSREFVTDEVTSRFMKHLFEPATASGAVGITRAQPDVFIHVKTGTNSYEAVQAAASKFHATKFEITSGSDTVSREHDLANPKCFHPGYKHGTRVLGLISYYKSIHRCLQLVKEAEEKNNGNKYDSVVFMRPDHKWALESEIKIKHASHASMGGAPVQKRIQCSKSMYAADLYSFQTRAAFEHYGNIYMDQFRNPNPSYCDMHTANEGMVVNVVNEINMESPGTAIYSNDYLDAR